MVGKIFNPAVRFLATVGIRMSVPGCDFKFVGRQFKIPGSLRSFVGSLLQKMMKNWVLDIPKDQFTNWPLPHNRTYYFSPTTVILKIPAPDARNSSSWAFET